MGEISILAERPPFGTLLERTYHFSSFETSEAVALMCGGPCGVRNKQVEVKAGS